MIVYDQMSKTMRDTKEIGSMVYRYLLPLESNNTLLNKFIKMRCVPLIEGLHNDSDGMIQVVYGHRPPPPALSVRAILLIQVSKQFSTLPKPFSVKGFLASFSSFIKGQS